VLLLSLKWWKVDVSLNVCLFMTSIGHAHVLT
jgi:hypothetical protein